MDKKTYN